MRDSKKIWAIALPALAENFLQMSMGFVDNYLVAQLGLLAVSGVSLANNILAIYQSVFIALGVAVSSLIAKPYKEGKGNVAYQSQALSLTLMISLVLGGLSILGGQGLLSLLGAEEKLIFPAHLYLSIVGGGAFSLGLFLVFGAILRAQGQARLPMYVSLFANALNALLSALAVFVFDFGIVGVAAATVLSRVIGLLVLVRFLPIKKMIRQMTWRLDKTLLDLTLPAAGERLMMRAGDVIVVTLIVGLGTEALAGNSIGETLTQFNYMPGLAFATATVILIAGSTEAERHRLIKTIYSQASLAMLVISSSVFLLGPHLITLFTGNSRAVDSASMVLLFSFLGTLATSGTLIYSAVWQGLGNSKLPFYATTFGMWGVRIFLGYLLTKYTQLGLAGIWLATIADNVWRFAFLAWKYHRYEKQ